LLVSIIHLPLFEVAFGLISAFPTTSYFLGGFSRDCIPLK
jgi:hypothetical protein